MFGFLCFFAVLLLPVLDGFDYAIFALSTLKAVHAGDKSRQHQEILGTLCIEPRAAGREASMLSTVLCTLPHWFSTFHRNIGTSPRAYTSKGSSVFHCVALHFFVTLALPYAQALPRVYF